MPGFSTNGCPRDCSCCGGVAHVRRDRAHGAFEHSVLLERVGGELELHALAGFDEADVVVADAHFGHQRFVLRHYSKQHGARGDDGADGGSCQVLDDAGLRRLQLEHRFAVALLGGFLIQPRQLSLRFDALVLQLAAVLAGEVGDALVLRGELRCEAGHGGLLALQILLQVDRFAALVLHGERAEEAFLDELLVGIGLLLHEGGRGRELVQRFVGGAQFGADAVALRVLLR
jgi:hypothetical protein